MRTTNLKVTQIDHVVLHVTDIERSKSFYMDVLGFEFRREHTDGDQKISFLACGNQGLDLIEISDGEVYGGKEMNHLALCIAEGERDEIMGELAKVGIEATARPSDPTTVYFADPDGHRIQLLSVSRQRSDVAREAARTSALSSPIG
jgi:catechol 2,3-dioxygenase-like lactoylglutathione lyase family enzyme